MLDFLKKLFNKKPKEIVIEHSFRRNPNPPTIMSLAKYLKHCKKNKATTLTLANMKLQNEIPNQLNLLIEHIAKYNVTFLNLDLTYLNDETFIQICESLHNSITIRRISIIENPLITEESLPALNELLESNKSITQVNCEISPLPNQRSNINLWQKINTNINNNRDTQEQIQEDINKINKSMQYISSSDTNFSKDLNYIIIYYLFPVNIIDLSNLKKETNKTNFVSKYGKIDDKSSILTI